MLPPLPTIPNAALSSTTRTRTRTRPQKRTREAELPSPPRSNPTPEKPLKKQKTYHQARDELHAGTLRPPEFWDNLSHVPLVKSALRELDRRTVKHVAAPRPIVSKPLDILRYARHGGPDLSDLRGVTRPPSVMHRGRPGKARGRIGKSPARGRAGARASRSSRSSRAESEGKTTKTKSSSPYDAAFKQQLIDFNIYPINHILASNAPPAAPDNLQDIIHEVCGNGRASLEPEAFGSEQHERFWRSYILGTSEEPQSRTLDMIEGDKLSLSSAHVKRGPAKLNNLRPLVPANFVPGNPDRVYGARPETLDRSVRDRLETLILPTTAKDILCPNFIVHVKGPDGTPKVAEIQAVYDGALAARGIQALWEFGSERGPQQNAEQQEREREREQEEEQEEQATIARTITCTFADGVLRMFAVARRHRDPASRRLRRLRLQQQTRSQPDDIEYVTTRLGSWFMAEELDGFRKGALAFRNGLEWARKQRDEAIERANERVRTDASEPDENGTSQAISTYYTDDPML